MKEKIKCLRCGKCCVYPDEIGIWRWCKYLVRDQTNFTTCTRYHKRLGTNINIDSGAICVLESEYNIPGCPFNRPDKENHPFWKMEEK